MNKRALGYLSWLALRKRQHKSRILDALLMDLQALGPDHIAITGDLTQIGTRGEYRQARRWLRELGSPERVTIIPGNHDRYTGSSWYESLRHWLPYLRDEVHEDRECLYPVVRQRGNVAMIALSSAAPTLPFLATGRIGRAQLQRLDGLLADLGRRNLIRVLLLHHGPLPGSDSIRRRLVDGGELVSVLRERGAELILHGHSHVNSEGVIKGAHADIPVFGVASASMKSSAGNRSSSYNLFRISRDRTGVVIGHTCRCYDELTGQFTSNASRLIPYPHLRGNGAVAAPEAGARQYSSPRSQAR